MNESVIYALISLLFAGANDTMFKRQAISGQCQGQYMVIVGFVWAAVFAAAAFFQNDYLPNSTTIVYGLTAGLFSAVANYLLIYSMQKLEAGIAATIYRLNLAMAAFLAILFLNEKVSFSNTAGILMAVVSVILFSNRENRTSSKISIAVLIVIIASMLRALMGISYKLAMIKRVQMSLFLAVSGVCWMMIGIMSVFLGSKNFELHNGNLVRGIISGLLICSIVFFFAKALEKGQASIIIPITQMSFVVTTLLAWFFWRERIPLKAIIGMVIACVSVFLLSIK
jgi:bacterial/archaeal transporter family protein